MKKPMIVTKLKATQFLAIKGLAEAVYEGLDGNLNFPNPQPTLPVFQAALAELSEALEKWGPRKNRGSHTDYLNLVAAKERMHRVLTQLAAWCMSALNSALPNAERRALLSTTGYPLKRDGSPQGRLEAVDGMQQFFARNHRRGYITLRWKKPLNVTSSGNVKSFLIYRSATPEFSAADVADTVTKTTFTEAPGIGEWFYWVTAVNRNGPGAVGNSIAVEVFKTAQ